MRGSEWGLDVAARLADCAEKVTRKARKRFSEHELSIMTTRRARRWEQITQKKSHGKHGNHGFFLNTYHTNQANLSRQNQETPFVLVKTSVFDAIASYFSS